MPFMQLQPGRLREVEKDGGDLVECMRSCVLFWFSRPTSRDTRGSARKSYWESVLYEIHVGSNPDIILLIPQHLCICTF